MSRSICSAALLLLWTGVSIAQDAAGNWATYKALKCPPPVSAGTWAVLDRDGANRQVPRYLSSLGGGESGTGVIASPSFRIAAETIAFTICGHDGQGGGQKKNFIALVDAKTGDALRQTMAPGADAVQEKSWAVAELRDREVRVEVHDGDPGGAFAWLGIGRIDAGPAMRIDFRDGMPKGWVSRSTPSAEPRTEVLRGGIPFLRYTSQYTMVPASGALEIPCGFAAERLFILGCTIPSGRPLEIYGQIDIVYRNGSSESYPLMYGYTLDLAGKMLSQSRAMYLHPSADVFEHYLVLGPRSEVIETIVLRRNSKQDVLPRITAVTCQTRAESKHLEPLPAAKLPADEEAWIRAHTIRAKAPDMEQIISEIRRAHKFP
jgi:hypothetical protein